MRSTSNRGCSLLVAVSALLLGCQGTETEVRVVAVTSRGQPLSSLEVTALPFDPDRLRDSLAAASDTRAPSFPGLESELRAYQRPEEREFSGVGATWRATWDSVQSLADSLRSRSPTGPGYRASYGRLRELYRRLAQRAAERDSRYREQFGDDRQLAFRAAAAADSLRAWERGAYADFAGLADSEVDRAGRRWQAGVTNQDGILGLELEEGAWWFIARIPDVANPFLEHYWNVPVVVRAIGPPVVPLYEGNAVTRWRH